LARTAANPSRACREVLVVERQQRVEELVTVARVLAGLLLVPRARQHGDALLARHDHSAVGLLHLHPVHVVELGLGAVHQRWVGRHLERATQLFLGQLALTALPQQQPLRDAVLGDAVAASVDARDHAVTLRATVAGEGVTRLLERQLGLAEGSAREELLGLAEVGVGVAADEFLEE
jgi:hypothetical protein